MLSALGDNAYEAFQASNDLRDVVKRCLANQSKGGIKVWSFSMLASKVHPRSCVFASRTRPLLFSLQKKLSVRATLMTPIRPMLAEACRGVKAAMTKAPFGLYAEIKYNGLI